MATVLNLKPHVGATLHTTSCTIPKGRMAKVQAVLADLSINGTDIYPLKTLYVKASTVAQAYGAAHSAANDLYVDAPGAVVKNFYGRKSGQSLTHTSYYGYSYLGYGKDSLKHALYTSAKMYSHNTITYVLQNQAVIMPTQHLVIRSYCYTANSSSYPVTQETWVQFQDLGDMPSEFWLKEGDVVNSGRYVLTEYLS